MKGWEEKDQIYKHPCLFFAKKHWSHWNVNCIIVVSKIHILPIRLVVYMCSVSQWNSLNIQETESTHLFLSSWELEACLHAT